MSMLSYWHYFATAVIIVFMVMIIFYMENVHQIDYRLAHKMHPPPKSVNRRVKWRQQYEAVYNMDKCKKFRNLKKLLLAINYNFPHYSSIPILKEVYGDVFGKLIFCGANDHSDVIKIDENNGYQGYECVATAIRMYPGFSGYIHSNDDVILNWWNLGDSDILKIWTSREFIFNYGHVFGDPVLPNWYWWTVEDTAHRCEVAFNEVVRFASTKEGIEFDMPKYLKRYFVNSNNTKRCINAWSDFFYVPSEFADVFAKVSQIYSKNKVFLEVAVPGIIGFFLNKTNNINLNGEYFLGTYGYSKKYHSGEAFYEVYSVEKTFYHPFKPDGNMKIANNNFYRNVFMRYGELVKRSCH